MSSTRLLSVQRVEHESYKNVTYGRWAARAKFAFPAGRYNSVMQPNSVVVIVGKSTSEVMLGCVGAKKIRAEQCYHPAMVLGVGPNPYRCMSV